MPSIITNRLLLFILFLFSSTNSFSYGEDSLVFIDSVKQFAYRAAEIDSLKEFYTKWSSEEKPYLYVYVSEASRINHPDSIYTFYYCGTDEKKAALKEEEFKAKGYHTFCYKTYANSAAELNKRFVSYSKDAIAFILLHEFTHNFIKLKRLNVPYEYNESLADVIGNYGALEFAMNAGNVNIDSVKHQIKINEKIYSLLNKTINKINRNPKKTEAINSKCNNKITKILLHSNSFQKDRFGYTVNNAFLLKNEYYCKNYFLLKKVYKKQKSIKAIIKIMMSLPANVGDCEKYLKKYI